MKKRKTDGEALKRYIHEAGLVYKEFEPDATKATISRYVEGTDGYRLETLQRIVERINSGLSRHGLRTIGVADVLTREDITLTDCLYDCLGWEPYLDADDLVLDIIALDMTQGWENLMTAFGKTRATRIRTRLLMLASRVTGVPDGSPALDDVKAWCVSADAMYEKMQRLMKEYQEGYRIRVEPRRYTSLPTYHGARVVADENARHYVTKCRERDWIVREYGFGEHEYLIIADGEAAPLAAAYRAAFDERFLELWDGSAAGPVLGLD